MTELTQLHTQAPGRTDGHDADGVPGDCFRTAVASLLDYDDPARVPHFAQLPTERWWNETREFLQVQHNLDLLYFEAAEDGEWLTAFAPSVGRVLVGGPSPRGSFGHVVVGTLDGRTTWDPHPSRAGLTTVTEFFVPVRPYDADTPIVEIRPVRL